MTEQVGGDLRAEKITRTRIRPRSCRDLATAAGIRGKIVKHRPARISYSFGEEQDRSWGCGWWRRQIWLSSVSSDEKPRPLLFAFLAWQQTFPSACPPSSHHSRNEVRSPFYCFCCSFLCWRVCSVVDPQHANQCDRMSTPSVILEWWHCTLLPHRPCWCYTQCRSPL